MNDLLVLVLFLGVVTSVPLFCGCLVAALVTEKLVACFRSL